MRELPILFSGEMVRAILDEHKSMTRRIMKPQPLFYTGRRYIMPDDSPKKWHDCDDIFEAGFCPYGQPGDRLWVRETTWISECKRYIAQGLERGYNSELDVVDLETGKRYIHQHVGEGDYAVADGMITSWSNRGRYLRSGREIEGFDIGLADVDTAVKAILFSGNIILKKYDAQFRKKLPSIYMPKAAARIWLEVTDVRVERLQEITDVNALKEGCIGTVCKHLNRDEHGCTDCMNSGWIEPPRVEFFELWDSLNVKRGYGWDTNPWVWVIEFRRTNP